MFRKMLRRQADRKFLFLSGQFDADWYLACNPDIAKAGANPLIHYINYGAAEGRDPHPLFDTDWYLANNPDVAQVGANPFVHYLKHGVFEGRDPRKLRTASGGIDSIHLSHSGYALITGWIDDEGHGFGELTLASHRLSSTEASARIPRDSILRHQRHDVGDLLGKVGYDFGFVIFDKIAVDFLCDNEITLKIASRSYKCQISSSPKIVSDSRILSLALTAIGSCESACDREVALTDFLAGPAGRNLKLLNESIIQESARHYYVERFGDTSPSLFTFVTVLSDTPDPVRFQPAQFRHCGLEGGEWIYVCTAPEHAEALLRLGKLSYDMDEIGKLTLILLARNNVGHGIASNIAVEHATSDQINLISPNLYPMSAHAKLLSATLGTPIPPNTLQGGLLFYDNATLMHSGMYFNREVFTRCANHSDNSEVSPNEHVALVGLENFDKGMPFVTERWNEPRIVPAVSGAFMRFARGAFERANGFSSDFILGHWGDADLCLRWSESIGKVEVNPGVRLLNLEGHGLRRPEASTAWRVNRCFFYQKYKGLLEYPAEVPRRTSSPGISAGSPIGRAIQRP